MEVLIFGKETEERGKRELLDGGGKRTPSMLNLPLTSHRQRNLLPLTITDRNKGSLTSPEWQRSHKMWQKFAEEEKIKAADDTG